MWAASCQLQGSLTAGPAYCAVCGPPCSCVKRLVKYKMVAQHLSTPLAARKLSQAAATHSKPALFNARRLIGGQQPLASRCQSTIRDIQTSLANGDVKVSELLDQYLKTAAEQESRCSSFITLAEDAARKQALALDKRIAAEGVSAIGPLAGVPVAIKDNLCTAGMMTTAGSRVLEGYMPPYDATSVARLKAAGALVIGKTNMDQFGMGSTTENSGFHVTRNPWDLSRVPGGSSGGSAAAVAAGQCVASLGSDTGGSIRQPAHFCGVVGIKPTYGRVSRYGLIAYASSLDVVGPLATNVEDAARVLSVIAGPDSADATCSSRTPEDMAAHIHTVGYSSSLPLSGKRVALIKETLGEGVDTDVAEAVASAGKLLCDLGAAVEEVSLPSFSLGLPAYYVIALSEASSNLSRYDGIRYGLRAHAEQVADVFCQTRGTGLGEEVKRRILMGTYALSAGYYDAYYKRAQQVRTLIQREMGTALTQYDVLLCPAAPTPAYPLNEKMSDPLAMYKGDLMTVNLNLAGLPAITLPVSYTSTAPKLPIGVQLIGRAFGEAELIGLAHALEGQTGMKGLVAGEPQQQKGQPVLA